MEEENLNGKQSSSHHQPQKPKPGFFFTEDGSQPFKKLKIEEISEKMDLEPLFQPRSGGIGSERLIGNTGFGRRTTATRQSFDSHFPKSRFESELTNLHQTHMLFQKIAGSSGTSKVYKAIDLKDCTMKALKIVSGKYHSKPPILEAQIHEKLSNMGSNVPKLYGSWLEKNRLIMQMELCKENLASLMKTRLKFNSQFKEDEILCFMLDIVTVLYQLHTLNYAHLDIKPGRMK